MEIRRIFPSRPEVIPTGPIAATRLPLLLAGAAFTGRRLALELESTVSAVAGVRVLRQVLAFSGMLSQHILSREERALPAEAVRPLP
ncbi:MAG: hypothetical protein ACYCPO_01260 [Acidobacteriaceae bacterium]